MDPINTSQSPSTHLQGEKTLQKSKNDNISFLSLPCFLFLAYSWFPFQLHTSFKSLGVPVYSYSLPSSFTGPSFYSEDHHNYMIAHRSVFRPSKLQIIVFYRLASPNLVSLCRESILIESILSIICISNPINFV